VVLPIGMANPMAKEHAVAKLDELLALGAEDIGAAAAREAEGRLSAVGAPESRIDTAESNLAALEIKASIVLADDVGGGWTNRYTTDAMARFPGRGGLKRPFATALVWTSESLTAGAMRQEVLSAIYRVAYQQRFGLPSSLRARLDQEGLAAVFAGVEPTLGEGELGRARAVIDALGDDPPYPKTFAALYGDAAAKQLGYQQLGLPPWAGFSVALARALEQARDPVQALLGAGPGRRVVDEAKRGRQHAPDQYRHPRR
jgi:hypothetical protein